MCRTHARRLHIVDHRRLAKGAFDGGEGRLDAGPRALALEAFDQPRLLATNVGRGAAVEENVQRKAGALNVLAEVAFGVAFVHCLLHSLPRERVLVTHVKVGRRRPRGKAAHHQALQDLMGILLHEDAIVERARLALVGIETEVDRPWMILGEKRPLQSRGEAGAAAAAQGARFHLVDHVSRLALEHLEPRSIAAGLFVHWQRVAVVLVDLGKQYRLESGHGEEWGGRSDWWLGSSVGRQRSAMSVVSACFPLIFQRIEKLVGVVMGHRLVQVVARKHARSVFARAQTLAKLQRQLAVVGCPTGLDAGLLAHVL